MNSGWNTFGWTEKESEKLCQIIKTRLKYIQRQSEKMKENVSLVSFWNMEQERGEKCI